MQGKVLAIISSLPDISAEGMFITSFVGRLLGLSHYKSQVLLELLIVLLLFSLI